MEVELDIFSGRPNPRWHLDRHAGLEVWRLQSLLTAGGPAPALPGLGYRGFVCTDPAGALRAVRGWVLWTDRTFPDPWLSVERYLLGTVPAEFAAFAARIASELAPFRR